MFDCIVIGAGPAGLTAATYLARFLPKVVVLDAGESRLQRIPFSRNVPGFPDGIRGADLLDRLQRQAGAYGAQRRSGLVKAIQLAPGGFRVTASEEFAARTVLLATGVEMHEPAIEGLKDAFSQRLVRYCPVCDGFEAQGKRAAVLGGRSRSIEEARLLKRYVADLTFVAGDRTHGLDAKEIGIARAEGIKIAEGVAHTIEISNRRIQIRLSAGDTSEFDILCPCLGARPRSELLSSIGGRTCPDGGILTDPHQETNVKGVYAAGDVLKGLDQIASACGQAAIAATAIHNRLLETDHTAPAD